jgi:hypothetical protein
MGGPGQKNLLKLNQNSVKNMALPLHPLPPPPPPDHTGLPQEILFWGSRNLRSGGVLGGPGEVCVKFGGKETTLGAYLRPHEGGTAKSKAMIVCIRSPP